MDSAGLPHDLLGLSAVVLLALLNMPACTARRATNTLPKWLPGAMVVGMLLAAFALGRVRTVPSANLRTGPSR
jgi:ABC-type Mn2+/Zn2+ transport system permease subunit